ncbi:hypothetical protein CSAL01_02110 [Colletotrichum salicis]|uniref:Short-chain dehydrogenase n=1 Tax=Colletotrichum salicis TaxID=1209931 RepID=A0A135UZX6_9PEZI|nr:hypothetical protein CSAL01_02110 [Colletotrichum salicis]
MAIGTTPKSVIVTGGASGIGLTIVRHFASQGGKIAIFDVNAASGMSIASDVASEYPQSTVTFHQCDVSSWKEQAQAFSDVYDAFGRIDIVFANAGIAEGMSNALATIHPDAPQEPNLKVVAVDLNGVIYFGPMYAAAKAGVNGLVRSTAPILEDLKIQINTMAPAALVTNIIPDPEMYKHMVVTPMSTLVKGVSQIIGTPSLNGKVVEIHDDEPTIRDEPYQFVSDGTRHNQEKAWEMFNFFKSSTGGLHAP